MNAATNFNTDNPHDSDSDTNSDETADYYQPISSSDANDELDANNNQNINGYHHNHHHAIDDHHFSGVENGVRSLDLSDDDDDNDNDNDNDDEESRRVEMENAMRRAFEEDESRRNTPLSSENANRVMEAMRVVSFSGSAPDWIRRVPEDRWIHQLQRLRHPGSTA